VGYPTQQQKVDYLFKKIGFSASKTGVAEDQTSGFSGDTKKAPPNEAIPSPLVVPASSLWADTSYIPATPPTSSDGYVGVYKTTSSFRMTVDTTVSNNRTFIARDTWGNPASAIKGDWIDTQFGADYIIKVYKGDPSTSAATKILSAAGTSGKDDVWFFDYSSGVLNFNGEDLNGQLAGITTSNIYIVGYRYLGTKGVQPPGGIGTFHNLYVSGISTFVGAIDANGSLDVDGRSELDNVNIAETLNVVGITTFKDKVHLLDNDVLNLGGAVGETGDLLIFANGTTNSIDARNAPLAIRNNVSNTGGGYTHNIKIQAKTGENGAIFNPEGSVDLFYDDVLRLQTSGIGVTVFGQLDTTTLNVSGVSTFTGNIDANADIELAGNLAVTGISTFTGAIDANGSLDVDGRAELDNVYIAETLNVVGVSTFTGNIDANGDLDVDGRSELDNVNIAETLNVVGVSTFNEDVKFIGATSGRDITWDKSISRLHIADNADLAFGDGNDLIINHTGSHSFIQDAGSGNLNILSNSLYLQNTPGNEVYLRALANNQVDLYHNNNIKLTTTSTGINVTGDIVGSGSTAYSTGLIVGKQGAEFQGVVTASSFHGSGADLTDVISGVGIGTAGGVVGYAATIIHFKGAGVTTAYYSSATGIGTINFHSATTGGGGANVTVSDTPPGSPSAGDLWWESDIGELKIYYSDGDSAQWVDASGADSLVQIGTSAPTGAVSGDLWFNSETGDFMVYYTDANSSAWVSVNAVNSNTKWITNATGIHTTGNVGIGTTTATDPLTVVGAADIDGRLIVSGITTFGSHVYHGDNDRDIYGDGSDLQIFHNALDSHIDNNTGNLVLRTNVTSDVGGNIKLMPKSNENGIIITHDASVELYENNVKRLETTSTGVSITGNNVVSGNLTAVDGTLSGDLDVDGHTNLDNVSIAGVTTFANTARFSGDVNIVGTLTYEDVKNVDAIGVVTARAGINLTGGNITLGDSGGTTDDRIVLGAGSDLSLYHGGTASYLSHNGTGNLYIDSDTVALRKQNQQKYLLGQYGVTYLYHSGNQKFNTMDSGVNVTGITSTTHLNVTGVSTLSGQTTIAHTGYPQLILKDSDSNSPNDTNGISLRSANNTEYGFIGNESNGGHSLHIKTVNTVNPIRLKVNNTTRLEVGNSGCYVTGVFDVASGGTTNLRGDVYIPDKLIHIGDSDTSIRFPANDTIQFETGGGIRAQIGSGSDYILRLNNTNSTKRFSVKETTTSSGVYYNAHITGGSHLANYAVGIGFDPEGYAARTKIGIVAEGTGAGWSRGKLHFLLDNVSDGGEATLSESRMTITDGGNVGINENSPQDLLHIGGSSTDLRFTANQIKFYRDSDASYIDQYGTGSLVFRTTPSGSQLERLRIASDGKVLIGTTNVPSNKNTVTPSLNVSGSGVLGAAQITRHTSVGAGGALLHLAGTRGSDVNSYTILQDGDGIGTVAFNAADGNEFVVAAEISAQVDGTPGDNDMPGRLLFKTTADGASSPTERLRITSAGKVGINTTNPGAKLSIWADDSDTDTDVFQIRGKTGAFNIRVNDADASNPEWAIRTYSQEPIVFMQGTTEKLRIDSSGNICGASGIINLKNPSGSGDVFVNMLGTSGDARLDLESTGNGNYSGIDFVRERSSGTGVVGGAIFMKSDTSNNLAHLYIQAQSASAQSPVTSALAANNGVRLLLEGGSGKFGISTGDTERFLLTASGGCHIGLPATTNSWDTHAISLTTNSATFACPGTLTLFGGTGYGTANMAGAGLRFVGYYDSSNFTTFAHVAGVKENTTSGNYAGALTFHTRANGGLGAERLRITSTGKVGINEASNINGRLHVQHDAVAENILYATRYNDQGNDKPILAITEASMSTMTGTGLIIGNHNRHIHIGPVFDDSAAVTTASGKGIRIDADGRVLVSDDIGSTIPNQFPADNRQLMVYTSTNGQPIGNTACARVLIATDAKQTGAQGYHGSIDFGSSDATAASGAAEFNWRTAAIMCRGDGDTSPSIADGDLQFWTKSASGTMTHRFDIAPNGDLTATDTNGIGNLSDQRLKTNIQDFTYDLNKFKQLKTKTFDWINPEFHREGNQRGFLAQEIETVDPYWNYQFEVSKETAKKDYDLLSDGDENYTIIDHRPGKASKLNGKDAMYVSVIQQLMSKIETLEAKVAALES